MAAKRELMTRGLMDYQRQLEVENAEPVVEASHDALTGLLNRSDLAGRDDPEAVFRAAGQALYRAKRAGRNRIQAAED